MRGIQRMVTDGASCIDVLTQIAAARAALEAVGVALLESRIHDCLDADTADRAETRQLVTAVERLVRR